MRTIQFKAKSQATGEWIYGDVTHKGTYTFIRHLATVSGQPDYIEETINPDTICQFTGMYAEGHTPIYENDIVEVFYYNDAYGIDMSCQGIVKWIYWGYFLEVTENYKYKHKDSDTLSLPYDDTESYIKFIRNKYDNSYDTDKKTCRHCAHRERWECGSKVISYCNKLKSNRTQNGMHKVKCTDPACDYYEEENL